MLVESYITLAKVKKMKSKGIKVKGLLSKNVVAVVELSKNDVAVAVVYLFID